MKQPPPFRSDLSIVSVYHNRLSGRFLELNHDLVSRLNPGMQPTWLIGDNTPSGFTEKARLPGAIHIPNPKDFGAKGSHQHASAINACLEGVNTRFVMSLDSDFYVLRPRWISDILWQMVSQNIAFFGVTYHPKEYVKYRYFPSVVCMIIDLDQIQKEQLDFMPQFALDEKGDMVRKAPRKSRSKTKKYVKSMLPIALASALGRVKKTFDMRERAQVIGSARDTSYQIYSSFGTNPRFGREYAEAVYDPQKEQHFRNMVSFGVNRALEQVLPDRLCYIPKKRNAYTPAGFRERGFPDCAQYGWEEYIWQSKPFGIHLRGSKTWKRNPSEEEELMLVKEMLRRF